MATSYNVKFAQEGMNNNIILYCADAVDCTTMVYSVSIVEDDFRNLIVMKVKEERSYGLNNIIKHEYDIHIYDGTRKEIQSEINRILTDILLINKESAYSHDKFKSFIDKTIDEIVANSYELTHLIIDIEHAEKASIWHNFRNDIADIKKTDHLHVKLPPDFDFESNLCLTYPDGSFEFKITSDIADALCKKYTTFLRRDSKNKTFVMIPAGNIYTPGPGYYYSFKKPKPKK